RRPARLVARVHKHDAGIADRDLGMHDRAIGRLVAHDLLGTERLPQKVDELCRALHAEIGRDGMISFRNGSDCHWAVSSSIGWGTRSLGPESGFCAQPRRSTKKGILIMRPWNPWNYCFVHAVIAAVDTAPPITHGRPNSI